ncbi:MAG: CVNH domain-containing protein [Candidatus Angelobacter sp.]
MHSSGTFNFFAVMILLGCAARVSAAQKANPEGSYQKTCSDVSAKKGTLYAKCQDTEGKSHSAKLSHYEKCTDIANNNGKLECAGGAQAAAPALPAGSYTDSCKNIQMKGTTLHAICKSLDGREMPTSLKSANSCAEGVANVNGIQNCEVSGVLPPGSYIATCKDVRLQGTTLSAACNDGKDHWRNTGLRDVQKCNGDIANQNGRLRCVPVKKMEKR